ncbi:MAG: TonB-dependent receptor [Chitinophagales bacterium]|nr:TonB-dependent receptor [Chitinophagales bacterium]MDW8272737.1 TonB-dependent receptor [Chitinophagales bacterium]
MLRIGLFLCLILEAIIPLSAQQCIVKGVVRDASTREVLVNVAVYTSSDNATLTNVTGNYELKVPAGKNTIYFTYMGYAADSVLFEAEAGKVIFINKNLVPTDKELNTIVVSTSRFGKKIQKESVTMEVLKPRFMETNNITNALQAVNRTPGITVLDGSISIRGGSGYAYGSGSRVLMVVDELPLITPDRGEIRWELVPMENMSQMEVIKGSSTVQYGAAALNGVIHLRTAMPSDTPETNIQLYTEQVDVSNRVLKKDWQNKPEYAWWRNRIDLNYFQKPHQTGVTFLHKRRIGAFDMVFSGNLHAQQSHLNEEYDNRTRFTTKFRYAPKKFSGRLAFGLNSTLLYRKNGFQFYWKGDDKPFESASGVSIDERYFFAFIDPSLNYIDRRQNQHRFLGRWFYLNNVNGKRGPKAQFGIFDYQFRRDFGTLAKILIGVNNLHFWNEDGTLKNHRGNYGGIYLSGDLNYKGLSLNAGVRLEYFNLNKDFGLALLQFQNINKKGDTVKTTLPVFRFGVNYQFRKYNYLRACIATAYRFPSLAERFVNSDLGQLRIRDNPNILPENGYTFELGYKRSFNITDWRGYADAVVFWNEFSQMIEFQNTDLAIEQDDEGKPTLVAIFQSQNVTRARLFGWELGLVGEGKIGRVADITAMLGYTYVYPLNLDADGAQKDIGFAIDRAFATFIRPDSVNRLVMLKYRNRHVFKGDIDALLWKHYRIGTSLQYYSFMDNIDAFFEIAIPDLGENRRKQNYKGDFIWDLRVGYDLNRNLSFNFIVKNVLNRFYQLRPARPNQPRAFNVMLNFKF